MPGHQVSTSLVFLVSFVHKTMCPEFDLAIHGQWCNNSVCSMFSLGKWIQLNAMGLIACSQGRYIDETWWSTCQICEFGKLYFSHEVTRDGVRRSSAFVSCLNCRSAILRSCFGLGDLVRIFSYFGITLIADLHNEWLPRGIQSCQLTSICDQHGLRHSARFGIHGRRKYKKWSL